ncbi:MAG: hypothetical protein AAFV45_03910 [Pseudomonadota bacterium]
MLALRLQPKRLPQLLLRLLLEPLPLVAVVMVWLPQEQGQLAVVVVPASPLRVLEPLLVVASAWPLQEQWQLPVMAPLVLQRVRVTPEQAERPALRLQQVLVPPSLPRPLSEHRLYFAL